MGLLSFLDTLRAKSEAKRRRITLYTTGVIWGIIVLFWWVSFVGSDRTADTVPISELTSPWQGFAHTMKESGEEFKNAFSDLLSSVGSTESGDVEFDARNSEGLQRLREIGEGNSAGSATELENITPKKDASE